MRMKKYLKKPFFLLIIMFFNSCSHVKIITLNQPCRDVPHKYIKASNELARIYEEDQKDRQNLLQIDDPQYMAHVAKRDEERRAKVADYFARGCFKSGEDYEKAAMIFQHGNIPEHFYQAFIWAKTAMRLGNLKAQHLMNLSIDRFLVNSGFKQLFGSQATKVADKECWCLYQVESSFTDQERLSRKGKSLIEQISWLKTLNQDKNCPLWECSMELKPVAKNSFPEFW